MLLSYFKCLVVGQGLEPPKATSFEGLATTPHYAHPTRFICHLRIFLCSIVLPKF
jgi:hypothetical protein